MCLVVLALGASRRHAWLFAANRDERHARPSAAAAWWPDAPGVLGGRDLVAGGSWLAVDTRGRLAAVTNYRDPAAPPAPRSRGALVADFMTARVSPAAFAASLAARAADYAPFNLLLLDGRELRYVSNRGPSRPLAPGVHALSNAEYGADWPKVRRAREAMRAALEADDPIEACFALLAERVPAADPVERYTGSPFIEGRVYGTRCSTVVALAHDGLLTFVERSFDAHAKPAGEVRESFAIEPR